MDLDLAGRKAIVMGASRGIGLATAQLLRAEGASVAICARNAEGLKETQKELEAVGSAGTVFARPTDLEEDGAAASFVRDAIEALGGLDIYIHNASGFGTPGLEGWKKTFAIDVMAAVASVDEAIPALEASGLGSVTFIGSTASVQWFPRPGMKPTAYGPMKAAMRVFANELSQSLGRKKIRANVVSPGSTLFPGGNWERIQTENPKIWEGLVGQFPMGRLVSVDEVARTIVFVASPAGSGISGTHVVVDGAQHKGVL